MVPNPPDRPFTRQVALGYQVSCSVVLDDVTYLDSVILGQDNIDQCRQAYIDTQKAHLPLRTDFTNRWSAHFSYGELRSSDYPDYIIHQDLLDRLEATRVQFGRPMTVLRGYSSPFRLFTRIPSGPNYVGLPTYWEGSPESPHLYGIAVDIAVQDWNESGEVDDADWLMLADAFTGNNLAVDETLGRPTHVHAYLAQPAPEPMVEVTMTPVTAEPGWGSSRSWQVQEDPSGVRYCNCTQERNFAISGQVDPSLAGEQGYTGYVSLRVDEVAFSGGWGVVGRPLIHNPIPSVISGTSLTANGGHFQNITYTDTCEWGGKIQVRAYYLDGQSSHNSADTCSLTLAFLENLEVVYQPSSSIFMYRGSNDPVFLHNHYIDADYADDYQQIVADFRTRVQGAGLPVPVVWGNDISLQDGGRFDCFESWWGQDGELSHHFHRWGCDGDMKYDPGWRRYTDTWWIMQRVIRDVSHHDPQPEPRTFHIYFDCGAGCNAQ